MFLVDDELQFEVVEVLAPVGIAGFVDIYVSPGSLASLHPTEPPSVSHVALVSNDGGVFDSDVHSDAVLDGLFAALETTGAADQVQMRANKAILLNAADEDGALITSLFATVASFSVIAGMMLVTNLFVMMADERKATLGTLRAVGLKRIHVWRLFLLEGAAYALASALLGVAAGIGAGRLMASLTFTPGTFGRPETPMRFTVSAGTLLLGLLIGLLISLATIWVATWRIAQMPIIAALRDLPPDRSGRSRWPSVVGSGLGVALGVALAVFGLGGSPLALMAGPPVMLLMAVPIVRLIRSEQVSRWAAPIAGVLSANPVKIDELRAMPEIASAAALRRGFTSLTGQAVDSQGTRIVGFDQDLLVAGVPQIADRLEQYPSDRAAFEAVLNDLSLVIVSDSLLSNGPVGNQRAKPGDQFTLGGEDGGQPLSVTVIGVTGNDLLFNPIFVSVPTLDKIMGAESTAARHYVKLAPDVNPDDIAPQLAARFLPNGANVRTIESVAVDALTSDARFVGVLRGFLGVGLLLGVAGIGVVMIRAVRERRRPIAMLRAVGVSRATVARAFVIEALIIAIAGVAVGASLALLTSWSVLVSSDTFGAQQPPFVIPWTVLAIITSVPILASALIAIIPAHRAAAIKPAIALAAPT